MEELTDVHSQTTGDIVKVKGPNKTCQLYIISMSMLAILVSTLKHNFCNGHFVTLCTYLGHIMFDLLCMLHEGSQEEI